MNRRFAAAALVLVLPVAALAVARVSGAVSLETPLQLYTSGDEPASLFAVWKAIAGQEVYADRFQRPFNAVFFNWLFYQVYALAVGTVQDLLGLSDDWLPTIGRLFTLTGLALAAVLFLRLGRRLGVSAGLAALAAAAFFLGPLFGFWSITMRPDVWAMVCELLALTWLIRFWPARPLLALAGFAVLAWAAWSFKQPAITTLAGTGLFLLLRRRFALLAVLVAAMVALFGATLYLGGAQYRSTILFAEMPLRFTLSSMVFTMGMGMAKGAPVWAALLALAVVHVRRRGWARLWGDDLAVLLAACTVTGLGLIFLASFQDGAAENYLFVPSVNGALLALRLWVLLGERPARPVALAALAGVAANAALAILTLTGQGGMVSLRPYHDAFTAMRACVKDLPRPYFVANQYMSLPWMSPGNEPFVLSFVYERDRQRGRRFADGGIGGLVEAGHFAAIALPGTTEATRFDGASLDRYVRRPAPCAGMGIWDRTPSP